MRIVLFAFVFAALMSTVALAADPATPVKPVLKITPGKAIVPTDNMRRPWGELISLDLKTRTGTFRREPTDEIFSFTVVPYAELLHHAAFGDLEDFRVGERAIFRLHPNEKGQWVWLTYIQDEMNFLNGHKEFYYVDKIDGATGQLVCTDANADKSFVRKQGIVILTDGETRYWKNGEPASFADIQVGDKLRTQTHGNGHGDAHIAWNVFLDEASLLKFQAAQKAVHAERMQRDGLPGYVDARTGGELKLAMFRETGEFVGRIKPGSAVRVAPAGVDRRPTADPVAAKVTAVQGNLLTLTLPAETAILPSGALVRLWTTP